MTALVCGHSNSSSVVWRLRACETHAQLANMARGYLNLTQDEKLTAQTGERNNLGLINKRRANAGK